MLKFSLPALAALMFTATASAAAPDTTKIAAVVTAALQEFDVPGAAVAVYAPGTSWVRTFGLGNVAANRAIRPGDHFGIRSVTKSFVVTLVLQLIANSGGAMTLDDPIGKYLPDIPNGNLVTLRQLANMTSGLYNYTTDPAFRAELGDHPLRHWSVDQLLAYALYSNHHSAIVFPPGAQYQYSNTNTLLLGKLAEQLTGKRFCDMLNGMILRQSGMIDTANVTGVDLPPPAVTGYQGFIDDTPEPAVSNASALNFAGSMASTIRDLAIWGGVLVRGDLLPAALQNQRFQSNPTAGDPDSPIYDSYGLGMGELAGWWGHTGSGLGFEAAVFYQRGRKQTFAILLNASNAHDVPARIFCRVRNLYNPPGAPMDAAPTICKTLGAAP